MVVKLDYEKIHDWKFYASDILVEYEQSVDEGLDIEKYKDLFEAVSKLPKDEIKKDLGDVIYKIVSNAKQKEDYPFNEPSELDAIRALRKPYPLCGEVDKAKLKDKIYGAWLGRVCGCFLGKPVEGVRSEELIPFLKETGNYPMSRYILRSDIKDGMCDKYNFDFGNENKIYADEAVCMPFDDDTNYTVLAQIIREKYGKDFTPHDVITAWSDNQPEYAYCTAERVAFRNFVNGFTPPRSALYQNPYREWIGAQIRGDYWGYINPGNPELAAEMAWRDASISHVKNGIYGEMFVAAMIASAAVTSGTEEIILCGLAQIPCTSRLYKDITDILDKFKSGVSRQDTFDYIHTRFDEHTGHGWCHTISNAMIVAASLLYGGGDFGKSICMAVQTAFDTDCNGATVGSILGMANGAQSIPESWSKPLNDSLETTIFNVGTVKISEMAKKTMAHIG